MMAFQSLPVPQNACFYPKRALVNHAGDAVVWYLPERSLVADGEVVSTGPAGLHCASDAPDRVEHGNSGPIRAHGT